MAVEASEKKEKNAQALGIFSIKGFSDESNKAGGKDESVVAEQSQS